MKISEELTNKIVDIIDPLCRRRYQEGDCLPRGQECATLSTVNRQQQWREQSARSKANRIAALLEKEPS